MGLNIKDEKTHRLAQELAALTGESMTAAVTAAVRERLDRIRRERGISLAEIEPVTEAQARIAREAYRDFGRGSGHPARLNFGDCFAYALARTTGEPLLFKGDDFTHTDVIPALR